jgi:hypothetical protein
LSWISVFTAGVLMLPSYVSAAADTSTDTAHRWRKLGLGMCLSGSAS